MKAPDIDGIRRELADGTTRRSILRILGGAVVMGAGAVVSGGASLVPSADAAKRSKKSISRRANSQADLCESDGGSATITKRPGGTTVTCTGGAQDGKVCTYTTNGSRCYNTRQAAPGNPNSAPIIPVITGGGPGPEPTPEPTNGSGEDPTGGSGGPIILFQ